MYISVPELKALLIIVLPYFYFRLIVNTIFNALIRNVSLQLISLVDNSFERSSEMRICFFAKANCWQCGTRGLRFSKTGIQLIPEHYDAA